MEYLNNLTEGSSNPIVKTLSNYDILFKMAFNIFSSKNALKIYDLGE